MDVLRTPDERFDGLPGYPFAPHYVEVPRGDGSGETLRRPLRRRGTARRDRDRAADARRAVVELPLPHDDPGDHRRRVPRRRPRPRRLRSLRQADRARRLHVPAPRRLDDAWSSRRSTSATSRSSARTGAASSASGSSPRTRIASPGSSRPTRSCRPATPRRVTRSCAWQKFSQDGARLRGRPDRQHRARRPTLTPEVDRGVRRAVPGRLLQGGRPPVPDARPDLARRPGIRGEPRRVGGARAAGRSRSSPRSRTPTRSPAAATACCRRRSRARPASRTPRSRAAATSSRRTAGRELARVVVDFVNATPDASMTTTLTAR